jgi:nucleoside-diphosphate-sugar epimerase
MKTVFVTGATGFLGTHLCHQLAEKGITIHAIKRASSSIRYLKDLPIHWVDADVLDMASLREACPEQIEAIFHIAADASMWAVRNQRQTQVNCVGTDNLIKLALEKDAQKFIYTSSIAAYGTHEDVITEEST